MKSILAGSDSRDMANGLPMAPILPVVVGIGRKWFRLDVVRTLMGANGSDEDGWMGMEEEWLEA